MGRKISKTIFPCVKYTNIEIQIHRYTNTYDITIILGQGVGEKDEEDVTTALTIDVPKVAFR